MGLVQPTKQAVKGPGSMKRVSNRLGQAVVVAETVQHGALLYIIILVYAPWHHTGVCSLAATRF